MTVSAMNNGPAAEVTSTSIMAIFAEWKSAHLRAEATKNDEECDKLCDRMSELEAQIMAIPATTPEETAAKVVAITNNFLFEISGHNAAALEGELRALVRI